MTGQLILHIARIISDIIMGFINMAGGTNMRYLPRSLIIPSYHCSPVEDIFFSETSKNCLKVKRYSNHLEIAS